MSDRYLRFVQDSAKALGKEFFVDSGEGNDWGQPSDEWYVEDLSGWLVDRKDIESFRAVLAEEGKRGARKRFSQAYCFVHWTLVNEQEPGKPPIAVQFKMAEGG